MALCEETLKDFGFRGYILQGPAGQGPGGDNLTWASVDILFDSLESLQGAMANAGKIGADVVNYTDCKPHISFCPIELYLQS